MAYLQEFAKSDGVRMQWLIGCQNPTVFGKELVKTLCQDRSSYIVLDRNVISFHFPFCF